MTASRRVTLFHCPNTRSTGARILLEELGADYELHSLNMKAEEQRSAAYLAVNPMGKVPAIKHGEALITEQGAVFLYLADLYMEKGLAPALDDPLRGPYLRWMVYYGSSFEPAVVDRVRKVAPSSTAMLPYGDFDTMLKTVTDQLQRGPYILGDKFSAADLLWGPALAWTTGFQIVPMSPLIQTYIDRINARPAVQRVTALDAELAAQQAKTVASTS